MGTDIRVAGLGAGYFSRFHYESWGRMAGTQLVGVCDMEVARAEAICPHAFSDLANMLATTRPDLLDIIVPPVAQADAIRAALAHGIRWLICQKPFCRDLGEAKEVVADVEAAGATLVVHENFRFQPWYRTMKRCLEQGALGDVLQMTFRLRPGDGQGADAYIDRQPYFQKMPRFLVHETAVHWVDTFRFLFEDPLAVYADLRKINPVIKGEDAGLVIFDHPRGVKCVFDGNRLLDHSAENHRRTMGEALVEGTSATLSLTGDGRVCLRQKGDRDLVEMLGPDRSETFGGDCVHALQSHVIGSMTGGSRPENLGQSYLKVLEIEEAIYGSAREGRKMVIRPVA